MTTTAATKPLKSWVIRGNDSEGRPEVTNVDLTLNPAFDPEAPDDEYRYHVAVVSEAGVELDLAGADTFADALDRARVLASRLEDEYRARESSRASKLARKLATLAEGGMATDGSPEAAALHAIADAFAAGRAAQVLEALEAAGLA